VHNIISPYGNAREHILKEITVYGPHTSTVTL